MTPIETLTWLKTKLKELDTQIWCSMRPQNCKGGIEIEVQRDVTNKVDLHSVLQPPILQDKIRDLLSEVTSRTVEFSANYYPEPVEPGKSRRQSWMDDEEWEDAQEDGYATFRKEGGWGGTHIVIGRVVRGRCLYRLKVQMPIEPIMCPREIEKVILQSLREDTWTKSERKIRGKTASRFFKPGEQLTRKEKPNPNEVLYFVTSYAIPGSGGAGVLKVIDLEKKKWKFICIPSPIRVGAFL